MKPLKQLSNTEKAEILHQLIPNEIPFLLEFMMGFSTEMIRSFDQWKASYDKFFIDAETWLGFIRSTETIIGKYGKRMKASKRLFADQLFDGLMACYTNHCITIYVNRKLYSDPKFYHAAHMMYTIEESIEETTEDQN